MKFIIKETTTLIEKYGPEFAEWLLIEGVKKGSKELVTYIKIFFRK